MQGVPFQGKVPGMGNRGEMMFYELECAVCGKPVEFMGMPSEKPREITCDYCKRVNFREGE